MECAWQVVRASDKNKIKKKKKKTKASALACLCLILSFSQNSLLSLSASFSEMLNPSKYYFNHIPFSHNFIPGGNE